MNRPDRFLILLPVLLLAACTAAGVRDGKGDLGASRAERPGDVYAQMGRAYMNDGQPAVALRKLEYGLKVDPDNGRIHAVMGLLYQRLGKRNLAGEHLHRACELEPENPWFRNAWGSFLCEQGKYPEADEQFNRALSNPLYDRPWQAATNAGLCALRAGNKKQGEAYLHRALSADPADARALTAMTRVELERGNLDAATGYLKRYGRVAHPNPETLLLGARIARERHDAADFARYRKALETRFPDAPETQTVRELKQP
jgi:type IV pilus assembly protein PilF